MMSENPTREFLPRRADVEQGGEDEDRDPETTVVSRVFGVPPAAPSGIRMRVAPPRYRLLAQLGAGGMSTVFLSRDETLHRDVAVKTVAASQRNNPVTTAVIAREAVIQASLEHPAIPPVYDVGTDDDGTSFFTMRKIEGVSLETVLRKLRQDEPSFTDRFGQRRLLTAFSTVCAAVAFAHSKGVLHRDVKPSNIMFGEFGEVYLLDFGIAKMVTGPAEPWCEKAMLGTIGYVAPEQVRGEPVDDRTDVYSLGAVLFEILTHVRLHQREQHLALGATLHGVDARARARTSRLDVPPELEELCVRATALRPSDRITSALELRDAIERFLDGERNLARRRDLAKDYAEQAEGALLRATVRTAKGDTLGPMLRDQAFQAAHRALALEPTNTVATKVLAQLTTTTRPGPDVERSERGATLGLRRLLVRSAMVLFAVWLAGIGGASLLGFRHWGVAAVATVLASLVAGVIVVRSRVEATWVRVGGFTAGLVAAAFTSALFGPFILLPGWLACFAVIAITSTLPASAAGVTEPRRLRTYFFVAIVLTMLMPLALELLGIVPRSMLFRDGTIVLLPRAVDFPPALTTLFLVVSSVIVVVLPAIIAARARDYALEVERRAFETASTLSQLIPHRAHTAANVR